MGRVGGVPLYTSTISIFYWDGEIRVQDGAGVAISSPLTKEQCLVDIHAPTAPNLHPRQKEARNAKSKSLGK